MVYVPQRALLCALLLLCNTALYLARTCISVAIIYMFPSDADTEVPMNIMLARPPAISCWLLVQEPRCRLCEAAHDRTSGFT